VSGSASLRRELGIVDLALAQVLILIVPEFFGTAVKAGSSHVVLWIVAIVLFFIPHAFVVAHLNRLIPLEGGLYEWARIGFSDRVGFLAAWNIWLLQTIQVSQIGLVTTTYISYAAPRAAWIASSPPVLVIASIVLITLMMLFARFGLRVGKWVSNTGSIFTIFILAVLIVLPFLHLWRGNLTTYRPLSLVMPSISLFSLSIFSRMTFGALSGFETVAIFAGESHDPARNIARSILITAPLIAVLYILGTSAILAFVSPDAVDVIGPVPQALVRGFALFGVSGLGSIAVLFLLLNYLCTYPLYFSANSRLPLVAGWDHLLPSMVYALTSEVPNAGERHLVYGRCGTCGQYGGIGRSRESGVVCIASDLGMDLLWTRLPDDVRDPAVFSQGERVTAAKLAARRSRLGFPGHVVVRLAVCGANRPGG
jgi:amino acid transporter